MSESDTVGVLYKISPGYVQEYNGTLCQLRFFFHCLFPLPNHHLTWQVGNMIFWFFFSIVGQPMCVLLYYHDVMNRQAQAS